MSSSRLIPGEIRFADQEREILVGRAVTTLVVENVADRPIQVGSHFHFAQVNGGLKFDRAQAEGKRLAIASGTAIRFEPGASREVQLVELAGSQRVPGLQVRSAEQANQSVEEG